MLNGTESNYPLQPRSTGFGCKPQPSKPVISSAANRYVNQVAILMKLLVLQNGQVLSDWFVEDVTIVPFTGMEVRFSGDRVRQQHYSDSYPLYIPTTRGCGKRGFPSARLYFNHMSPRDINSEKSPNLNILLELKILQLNLVYYELQS